MVGQTAHPLPDGVEARVQRVIDRDAEADLGGDSCSPSSRTGGASARSSNRSGATQGAACCRSSAAPAAPAAPCGHRGSRCRAGRAGTCGRSPTACRSRSHRRRPASARPPGRRRADRECRARRAIRPTAAAGLTSPPLVGTWVIAMSLTRSSIMRSRASDIELRRRRRWGRPRCSAPVRLRDLKKGDVIGWHTRPARSGCGRRPEAARHRRPSASRPWRSPRGRLLPGRSSAAPLRHHRCARPHRRLPASAWSPPILASRCWCPITASTGRGISATSALLK